MFRPTIIALLALVTRSLFAGGPGGVVLDGSFGTSGALAGPSFMIPANVGKQVGGNLFHSFNQFDLNSTQSATFTGPNSVHNILSRVTSGSASSIDGLVRSDIAGANLFLLNPSGIMFGPHAQIDVSGSFAVSTAAYVKLASAGRFNTSLGGHDVLTSAPVTAFGFLNAAPAAVSISNSTLNVAPAESFSVVAGDIAISGGTIRGEASCVNLVSANSPGEAQLDVTKITGAIDTTQFAMLGQIHLTNSAQIDTSGPSGGPISIDGGNLFVRNASIRSNTLGSSHGAPIEIVVREDLDIGAAGQIDASTLSSGNAGNILLMAGSLAIESSAMRGTGILSRSLANATGDAGDVTLEITGALTMNGGVISTGTFSSGKGGNLFVEAGSLSIDGAVAPNAFTGIGAASAGEGDAGTLTVKVDNALTISRGGRIDTSTTSFGNGGDLLVTAGSVTIDSSAVSHTGIFSRSLKSATGDAGDVTLKVSGALTINGGVISTGTFSSGKGGDLLIEAGSLNIDGSVAPTAFTGIGAASAGEGDAGTLTVRVDNALTISNGGRIDTSTISSGQGGNLEINAASLSIASSAIPSTGIFSRSFRSATADAGNVTLEVSGALTINGGVISAGTFSSGKGGNLMIDAGSLNIDGSSAPNAFTGIAAASAGRGNAGNLAIKVEGPIRLESGAQIATNSTREGNAGTITVTTKDGLSLMNESSILASSNHTDAGMIVINALGRIRLSSGSNISTSAGANGGDIHLTARDLVYLTDSSIQATAGVDKRNGIGGQGGSITIDNPQFIVLDHSLISANAAKGRGGNITLASSFFLNSESLTTASGTQAGTVNIAAPTLDLSAALVTLSSSLLSAEAQLRERCTAQLRGDFSSFITLGRGGTESEPDELQVEF